MSRTPVTSYGAIIQDNCDSDSTNSVTIAAQGMDYEQPSPHREPSYDRERRRSFIEEDESSLHLEVRPKKEKNNIVTWSNLPHKSQLAILTIARFSEPLVQSSLRVSSIQIARIATLISTSLISSTNSNPLICPSQTLSLLLRLVLCREPLLLRNYAPPCYGADGLTEQGVRGSS